MLIIFLTASICLILNISSLLFESYIFENAPFLESAEDEKLIDKSLTIVIPTFNEEKNIIRCLNSLSKIKIPCNNLKILVIDDSSVDKTFLNAKNLIPKFLSKNIKLEIIPAGPRPKEDNWVGKNWPCYVGSKKVDSEWVLFLDADVEIGSRCIYNALYKSCNEEIDLLSLAPKVNCNCLAEWIVQPIMTSLLTIGFPISQTNDPESQTSFAAGPFMLFKKTSYLKIGGHKGTLDKVVEDLALAEKIKSFNFKLIFLIAINDISLNMYEDFSSLVEGWSKNWFLGLERNFLKSLSGSLYVFLTYSAPWLLFLLLVISNVIYDINLISVLSLIFSLFSILSYAYKRYWIKIKYALPMDYWYLNGFGGMVVVYISFLSIYKTITGLGWTWKGRQLSKVN